LARASLEAAAATQPEQASGLLPRTFHNSGAAQLLLSCDAVIAAVNSATCTLFSRRAEELLGKRLFELLTIVGPEPSSHLIDDLVSGRLAVAQVESRWHRPDGSAVEILISLASVQSPSGAVDELAVWLIELTNRHAADRSAAQNRSRWLPSRPDSLIGIGDRSQFLTRLVAATEHERSLGQPYALMFVAVDRLSAINQRYGEDVGNQILRAAAERLSQLLLPGSSIARYGGDRFAVLVERPEDRMAVEALAGQIARTLDDELVLGHTTVRASACVGVVHSPGLTAQAALAAATAATAQARSHGRAQVFVLDPETGERLGRECLLGKELGRALTEQQFVVHYQPIVELVSGAVVSLEALIRWQHPRLGLLGPDQFLQTASALDLLAEIDDWVLTQACRDVGSWRDAARPELSVAVNVTPDRLILKSFNEQVRSALRRFNVPATCLTLEVTETVVVEDLDAAAAALGELSKLGVGIAIDDFGTGYSSMLQLRRLPFNSLKIDREFVRLLPQNADDVAICTSVLELAQRLGVRTTAEGVERPEQAAMLMKLGCRYGQGFLWSSAVPAADVALLLEGPPWLRSATPPDCEVRGPMPTDDPLVCSLAAILKADGASLTSIAAHLNMRGLRTASGRRWQATTVARVLAG
jgi:diguanylate cyclase (GGDEF)-like protein